MADDVLDVNLGSLKVREIEELEELLGCNIEEAFGQGKPRGKALRALGYITRRRADPEFTWEQAGELVVQLDEKATDPTDAAGS